MPKQQITFHWQSANCVFPLEKHLQWEEKNLIEAKTNLLEKKGKSPEFTDWIPFIKESADQIIEQQKKCIEKIWTHSNAIVIIGIGGSLLGTKAVYEALTHSFALRDPQKCPGKPILFWAGHHLCSQELLELCETLNSFSPSLVVISKSGGTTEPALAFRILKQYLETRFSKQDCEKKIFAITDPHSGTLLNIAKENHFETFPIPKGIGGRYSVFTSVGLFPLALAGIDVVQFVQGGKEAHEICFNENSLEKNSGLCYAGVRNILYKNNYKIESLCVWTPKAKSLTEWWKQLFGESDGKDGTGIFPTSANFTTDLHSLGQYFQQGERHLFATHLKFGENNHIAIPNSSLPDGFEFLAGKNLSYVQQKAQEGTFLAHTEGKMPVLYWDIPSLNAYALGFWMFTNMFACAVGGTARGIDPFNQPGVENYKQNMFSLMGKPAAERKNNG